MIKKEKYKIFLNWFLVFLWLGVIYYFSNQPSLKSELKPIWDLIFRKLAHLSEFFVLTYLLYKAYSAQNLKAAPSLFLSLISAIVCAGYDEWHQSFIFGRSASLMDVFIDSAGVLIFCILQFFNSKLNFNNLKGNYENRHN